MAAFTDYFDFAHRDSFPTPLIMFVITIAALCLYLVYRLAFPKPLPGIPYNKSSAGNLLGDLPALMSHISKMEGNFATYLISTMESLNAPLVQVFLQPFGKPMLILGDFRESHDLLVRRKDFDRSPILGDILKCIIPNHHIGLKTNTKWKEHRRLIQDLMTPSFLHDIAGPIIYQNMSLLIELWQVKSRIAEGRPWEAEEDINRIALDAVMSFAFGERFVRNATIPTLEAVKSLNKNALKEMRNSGSIDELVHFPPGQVDELAQAILDLSHVSVEVQGSAFPNLTRLYWLRKPHIRRATKIKNEYILNELKNAVEKLEGGGKIARSAIGDMVKREKSLAERNGRKPDYFSPMMVDEVFGFVFGGHETTKTTVCWGLKLLADESSTQVKLRTVLHNSFPAAKSEGRNPTIQEITGTSMPYLDAWMEEVQRYCGNAPFVDREALVDTQLLGHHIPKGTIVTCMALGPSMTTPGFEIDEARRNENNKAFNREGRERIWDSEDISLFKPERWLIAGEKGEEFDPSAGPQLTFGLGTRGCYGKRLAYLEMRIVFTLIVWNFELLPCPPAFSSYKAVLSPQYAPKDCYVRLGEVV